MQKQWEQRKAEQAKQWEQQKAEQEKRWEQMQAECRAASEIHGPALQPGFEMLDDEGNTCVVFNVDGLPEMRRDYPNSNMLEDLLVKLSSYSAAYARPAVSRTKAVPASAMR